MPRSRRVQCVLFMMAALLAGFTSHVQAQGTMGTVPDPIGARELESYADRLALSRAQRQGLEPLHEQYRQEFAELRERDIEKFLNDSRGMGGGGMAMLFDRAATQKALKDLDDIHNKIRAVDNRFFDQVQGILTDEQSNRMPLVRAARERLRYRTGLSRLTTAMNAAAQIDLSEFLADMKLSPQEHETADPIIAQYETTLTSQARRLHDSTQSLITEGLNRLHDQGMTPDAVSGRDPQRRDRMFTNVRTIMSEIQLKIAERTSEITDLNRRTVRTLSTLLSPENARALRDQFYQRGYPELRSGSGAAIRAFDIVSKFNDLTDEQRQNIDVLRTEYFAAFDRIAEQGMDAIDSNRKTRSMFDMDRDSRRSFEEQLEALRDRRTKLNDSTVATVRGTLTPELIQRLDQRLADRGGSSEEATQNMTVTAVAGGGVIVQSTAATSADATVSIDPYIPAAISRRDVDGYASRIGLTADQRELFNSLHSDYLDRYKAVENDQIKAARQAERSMWAMEGGQVTPPTVNAVEALYAARQKALAAVLAIDGEFFDDAQVLLDNADGRKIDSLRSSRLRAVYSRAAANPVNMFAGGRTRPAGRDGNRAMRMFGGGTAEASVDLAAIVNSLQLNPNDATAFTATLAEYETSAVALFQSMFETTMRMQLASERMTAQMSGNRNDDPARRGERMGQDFRALAENEGRAANDARKAVASLNKSMLARLASALPESEANELRRAYNVKAFPTVYRDENSAQPYIASAMNLPDLNPQQRSQLQEIAVEFNGLHEQLCEQLVELESNAVMPDFSGGPGGAGGDWRTFQEQIRTREKLEFDRSDLNDKTLMRLRSVLNEQQVQQLGGLQPADRS